MSSPPSRVPTSRQPQTPTPLALPPAEEPPPLNRPVNRVREPPLRNPNLAIGLFPNLNQVVAPQTSVTPSPSQIPFAQPQSTVQQVQAPQQLQQPQQRNLMDELDAEGANVIEGEGIMKRNSRMSFYKVR